MMTDWSRIGSGPKFHALVGALLLLDDPGAKIFNREGPDGAIDALASDGSTVFQSKFHATGTSPSVIFSDVKKELTRIDRHRAEGSSWWAHWKNVSKWTLVTNVPVGPQDELRWQKDVVPEFEARGLVASRMFESKLEVMLATHPTIRDSFFDNRPRVFVSLAEHRESLLSLEVLERAYGVPLEGRAQELETIAKFVEQSTNQVLLVHGPGGVGKSRLLYEAAFRAQTDGRVDHVYSATPSLAIAADWHHGADPESRALVLLDDTVDTNLVRRFVGELRSRAKGWKAIVAVPSSCSPVVGMLTDPRDGILAPAIELKPLLEDDAVLHASALLSSLEIEDSQRRGISYRLAQVTGGYPAWMTIAVRLLENGASTRDLPSDPYRVAEAHVRAIQDHGRPEVRTAKQTLQMLRWIALVQPFNRESQSRLEVLASFVGFDAPEDADRALCDLDARGALTFFGRERRMVEVRPHVLRDYLLVDWLSYERNPGVRAFTADARKLAEDLALQATGEPGPEFERIVDALVRMELITEPRLRYLDPLAEALARQSERAVDTIDQRRLLKRASLIGPMRPELVVQIVRSIRKSLSVAHEHSADGDAIGRTQLLADATHELQSAARGADTSVIRASILDELMALIDLADEVPKALTKCLRNVIHGRHGYVSSFRDEAEQRATALLDRLDEGESPGESARSLLDAMCTLERHEMYASTDTPNSFVNSSATFRPTSAEGRFAMSVRVRLWDLTAGHRSTRSGRDCAWTLLAKLHAFMNAHRDEPEWQDIVADDLRRARAAVEQPVVSLADLHAARKIWSWHTTYDKDEDLSALGRECEAAYGAHPTIGRFAFFFKTSHDESEHVLSMSVEALLSSPIPERFENFFTDAAAVVGEHPDTWRIHKISRFAWALGEAGHAAPALNAFVEAQIGSGPSSPLFQVAVSVALGSVHAIRAEGGEALVETRLEALMTIAPDSLSRVALLDAFFVQPQGPIVRNWGAFEKRFLKRH